MSKTEAAESRVKQITAGAAICLGLAVLVCGALIGWRYLPGVLGEWIGTMVGVMTTPFFLEASFIFIGLTIVILLNHHRQKKDGEELVYLEQVDESSVAGVMPDHAKWAVYREAPLPGEEPSLLVQAEGAAAIGDWPELAELLGGMCESELQRPEVLVMRIAMAKVTGKQALIDALEAQLSSQNEAKARDGSLAEDPCLNPDGL
jgi:hypothetical protein